MALWRSHGYRSALSRRLAVIVLTRGPIGPEANARTRARRPARFRPSARVRRLVAIESGDSPQYSQQDDDDYRLVKNGWLSVRPSGTRTATDRRR